MDLKYGARRSVSIYAADLIEHCIGCTIAVGSGSTVKIFIDELVKRGIITRFRYVSTSFDTTLYLRKSGARDIETGICPGDIDIYIDSADEIDPRLNLLKGGGGALFREKIAMLSSNRRIIIADETKLVDKLGSTRAVPLEVEVYAINYVMREIERLGYRASYREAEGKLGPLISDNGNILIDVYTGPMEDPISIDRLLKNIEGVITTGIFPYMGYEVVIGRLNGAVEVLKR
ncbi:MAG: ribose 5-phosphate isomerase A [Sulfolobales archaeon]